MLAYVALLHRREGKEPVATCVEPCLVCVGNPLRRAGGATRVPDNEVVVFVHDGIRIGIRETGQPLLVVVASYDDVFQAVDLGIDAGKRFGMALADHHSPTACVGKHVAMGFTAVAWIERNPHQVCGGSAAEEVD